ncbi:MAG: amidophosphoribosyltransferase [Aigarchaeota archaeon]|nr:amidophosphoribosyltransferase [Candidatus Wolframiiraptor gerlachensis]
MTLNHRGHESYGVAVFNPYGHVSIEKGLGLISDLGLEELHAWERELRGRLGIGHVRYATSGQLSSKADLFADAQPVADEYLGKNLCIAFNGNVTNLLEVTEELAGGANRRSDAHALLRLLLEEYVKRDDVAGALRLIFEELGGAFALVGLTESGELFAFKDPHGIRPLSYGFSDDVGLVGVASESPALAVNGIGLSEELRPGELVIISDDGSVERKIVRSECECFCAFEYAYFARPDSRFRGCYVYEVRRELGRKLAQRYHEIARNIDVIVPVPQTAEDAAYGFHLETGKPVEPVIVRHRYLKHRAFITPAEQRKLILLHKYNLLLDRVRGKRVALIDDSIVRGDTLSHIIHVLRGAGAREVHVFSTFPKISNPCFYGIDMATFQELIGFNRDEEDVARLLGADSVNYQRIEDFCDAVGASNLCFACVTGGYPTPYAQKLAEEGRKLAFEGGRAEGRLFEVIGGGRCRA